MKYKDFCDLIKRDEDESLDFKIECNTFKRNIRENGELVKDIIAFANNGGMQSYLVIGVSDDRKNFKTITNPNLLTFA